MESAKPILHIIKIKDLNFSIQKKEINKGEIIKIVNKDLYRNAIVSVNNNIYNSDVLYQDSSYYIQINKKGTYKFISSLYRTMKPLIITVK